MSKLNFENKFFQQTALREQMCRESSEQTAIPCCLHSHVHHFLSSWNPRSIWIETLKRLAQAQHTQTLFHLGKKAAKNILFPQEIQTIQSALISMDTVYHDSYLEKGKNIGHYHFMSLDDQCAKIVCSTPYPCEFDRGIIEGICQRFKSKDIEFIIVEHLDGFPCRKKGSESCTYAISWIGTCKISQRFEKITVVPHCFH